MGKIRVAVVAPSLRILGGQAVQADELLRAWHDDPDVEAWLVPINPGAPRPLRFVADVKYLRTIVTELVYVPLLFRELARADLVHVFSASYSSFLLAPLPAAAVAAAMGKPVVLHYHSGEAPDHLKRSKVARFALARMTRNVVPSRFLVDVFASFALQAQSVPNVIDLQRFRFAEREGGGARILSTRNLDANYDVATTLRAFRIVQDRRPDASLTVVGHGPHEPMLRSLAGELQLRDVTFAGRVRPDQMPGYYASHDIYVQTPTVDNMPLSILEAFASGIPLVSTDVGGVPTLVTHGRSGLLAGVGDHPAIADRILTLLDNRDYARELARAGFESCRRFTWPVVRDEWLDLYRSVLSAAPAAAPSHAR